MSRNRAYAAVMLGALCIASPAFAQGMDVNKELVYRAALGRADDIKLMLNQGANVNMTNAEGVPLLLVAAARKDAEALPAVQALLEGGADVNTKDSNGQTALYYAARAGKPEVVDYLLKKQIDYYSLDNNGDIARTIAFRAGRTDIVKIMDDFVKGQTLQAQLTYDNAQTLIQKQQDEENRQSELEAQRREQERERIEREEKEEYERKLAQYQQNLKELDRKVYDISYNACAFQYWSFAQSANQTTELSDEETDEIIAIHRREVQDESLDVMNMFDVDQAYVNRIITPSKQAIYNILAAMPSRTYRKENGFGQIDDVEKRCEKIAKNWVVSAPKEPPVVKAATAAPKATNSNTSWSKPAPTKKKRRVVKKK